MKSYSITKRNNGYLTITTDSGDVAFLDTGVPFSSGDVFFDCGVRHDVLITDNSYVQGLKLR